MIGTPEGAVREMAGWGAAAGGKGLPSNERVWVRWVGNEAALDAIDGAMGAPRCPPPKAGLAASGEGAGAGAAAGEATGAGAEATCGAGGALATSRVTMAFFTLSISAWVSKGLSMKSSAPASRPRFGSYGA